jgi:hypothetical protein
MRGRIKSGKNCKRAIAMPKTGGRIHSSDIRKFRVTASDQEKERENLEVKERRFKLVQSAAYSLGYGDYVQRLAESTGITADSLDTRKPPAKTGRTADFS